MSVEAVDKGAFCKTWARRWQDARPQLKAKEPHSAVRSGVADAEALSLRVQLNNVRTLDFGCGHGRSALGLLLHGVNNYLGIDARLLAIEFARRLFAEQPGYQFEYFDSANGRYNKGGGPKLFLPVTARSFELALAVSVFSHEPDDEVVAHYLSELWRVLTPNGVLACTWITSAPMDHADNRFSIRTHEGIFALLNAWAVSDCWGAGEAGDQWWTLAHKSNKSPTVAGSHNHA